MSSPFQTWSPRTHPLIYDSLQSDMGCQVTPTGIGASSFLPFVQICIFEHTIIADSPYNQPDGISHAVGPMTTGGDKPWFTIWTAWKASAGIRIHKLPTVTPPADSTGTASSLYPTTDSAKVALGFTVNGEIALAVHKSTTSIQLKWIADHTGTNVGTVEFLGQSPVLFNSGLLLSSDGADDSDLAVFFLRSETPRSLYARFQSENFSIEHEVNADLQTGLARLIQAEAIDGRMTLYATDNLGRDIRLTSPEYKTTLNDDGAILSASIKSGSYQASAIPVTTDQDSGTLNIAIVSGRIDAPIITPGYSLSDDAQTLSVAIISGEYD